jgi:thioredoxin-related protein
LCTVADAAASPLAQRSRLPEIAGVKFLRLSAAAVAIIFALTAAPNARAESNWLTDYKKAQQEAKTNNKLLLLDFTGSDWCGWCIKLDKEVFSKPEFKDYANKNLVLMEVDFPRGKSQGSDIKKQNEGLAQQYQIEGFPTIVVLDGDGKKVGLLGYMPGGPTAFIAELEKLRKG